MYIVIELLYTYIYHNIYIHYKNCIYAYILWRLVSLKCHLFNHITWYNNSIVWSTASIYMKSLYSPHQRKVSHSCPAIAVGRTVGEPVLGDLTHPAHGCTPTLQHINWFSFASLWFLSHDATNNPPFSEPVRWWCSSRLLTPFGLGRLGWSP